jgi:DNA-binding PadR family transcriptional regulator
MFRYVVLGLLRHGPGHGYALMKELRRRSGWGTNPGNFYRELQRLAAEGLLRIVANPADADPRRSSYEITPAGELAFDQWLSEPAGLNAPRMDTLALRVFFLAEADPHAALAMLDRWHQDLWLQGKTVERARETALRRAAAAGAEALDALPCLLGRVMKQNAADLDFLEDFRATLELREKARAGSGGRDADALVAVAPRKAAQRRA